MGLKWRFSVLSVDYGEANVAIVVIFSFGGDYGMSEVRIVTFGR